MAEGSTDLSSCFQADDLTFPPTPLDRLQILALDCQTTGASPAKGRRLEIGFMPGCAARSETADARACLICQPAGAPLAPAVIRITGISEKDLCQAVPESAAWQMLLSASQHLAEHILEMLTQARALFHETTGSALEAALLENDEIKQHCPPYNIALRPEGRRLKFASRDLMRWSSHYDSEHRVGPLFDGRLTGALSAFAAWLGHGSRQDGSTQEANQRAIVGLFPQSGPDDAILQAGYALFRNRHAHRLTPDALRTVTSLGAQLWRSKMEIASVACEPGPQPADDPEQPLDNGIIPPVEWAPADIAGAVERMLMHAAHQMRRTRWFFILSDACLAWASPEDPDTLKNMLLFEKGTIVDRRSLLPGQKRPELPGWRRPWDERQKHITLFTCDRMRVVTTELRRLLCANRAIELRLSPKTALTRRATAKRPALDMIGENREIAAQVSSWKIFEKAWHIELNDKLINILQHFVIRIFIDFIGNILQCRLFFFQ